MKMIKSLFFTFLITILYCTLNIQAYAVHYETAQALHGFTISDNDYNFYKSYMDSLKFNGITPYKLNDEQIAEIEKEYYPNENSDYIDEKYPMSYQTYVSKNNKYTCYQFDWHERHHRHRQWDYHRVYQYLVVYDYKGTKIRDNFYKYNWTVDVPDRAVYKTLNDGTVIILIHGHFSNEYNHSDAQEMYVWGGSERFTLGNYNNLDHSLYNKRSLCEITNYYDRSNSQSLMTYFVYMGGIAKIGKSFTLTHSENDFSATVDDGFHTDFLLPIGNHGYGYQSKSQRLRRGGSYLVLTPYIYGKSMLDDTPSVNFSKIKRSVDNLVNSSVESMTNKLPNYKDKQLHYNIPFDTLYNYINNTPINNFADTYKSIYNGVDLNSPSHKQLTDSTVINSEAGLIGYINKLQSKFIDETNNITNYGNAFIESYNNNFKYMQHMDSNQLKHLFNYCIVQNTDILPKIDVLYKTFLGKDEIIYLPSDYTSSTYKGYKKYNDKLWYRLGTNTVDLATCIHYDKPNSINKITIK